MTANSTKTRKAKARVLQDLVAEKIRYVFGLTVADVAPAIMGDSGIDIKLSDKARELFPYGPECKFQESTSIWEWLAQAEENAKNEKLEPLLVFKRSRSKVYAVIEFDHFLKLVAKK